MSEIFADLDSHHIEGIAVHGDTPFRVPLVSHIVGNLFMGGCPKPLPTADLERFAAIVNLYPWERYPVPARTCLLVAQLYDAADLPDMGQLAMVSQFAAAACTVGPTLVHCQAGLNRSGLVCGLVLIGQGYEPDEAIALLREKRSPAVLCNAAFEAHLLSLAPGAFDYPGPAE